jgi:N-acetylmuramoyl-L-alanine amidase
MPDQPDHPRFDDEDDESYKQWARSREPENNEPVSASSAFLQMMRQAAERSQPSPPPTPPSAPPKPLRPPAPSAPPPQDIRDDENQVEDALDEAEETYDDDETDESDADSPSAPLVDEVTGEIRRPQRRRIQRGQRALSAVGGFMRSIFIMIVSAFLVATIFRWWTPPGFLPSSVRQDLAFEVNAALFTATPPPTALPTPNWAVRVGVVSGHRGPQNDPGAVCPDGLTEREINFNVAQVVVANLQNLGYTVDLLDEFDPRLQNYQAAALLSIHANTCREWPNGEVISGYLIAGPAARVTARGNDELLVDCISRFYALGTQLERREGTTIDMTDYHNFREIHPLTPGAIIELGFMRADRALLLQPDRLGQSLTQGMLCFLEPLRYQTTPLAPGAIIPTPGA